MNQPTSPVTTSDEVLGLFRTRHALRRFNEWMADPQRDGVRPAVLAHVSRFVYEVKSSDVTALRERIAKDSRKRYPDKMRTDPTHDKTRDPEALHALTVIRKDQRRDSRPRDWSPPLAFNHAFHILLERRRGKLFTYPEFVAACAADNEVLKPLLWDDAEQLYWVVA